MFLLFVELIHLFLVIAGFDDFSAGSVPQLEDAIDEQSGQAGINGNGHIPSDHPKPLNPFGSYPFYQRLKR
jgi:hypothetical protein